MSLDFICRWAQIAKGLEIWDDIGETQFIVQYISQSDAHTCTVLIAIKKKSLDTHMYLSIV